VDSPLWIDVDIAVVVVVVVGGGLSTGSFLISCICSSIVVGRFLVPIVIY
jgi:hypothetical protein